MTLFYYDPKFMEHITGNHPENAARIIAQGMANRAGRLSPTPSQSCRSNPSTRRTLPMSLIRRYSAANGLGITTPTTRAGHSPRGRDIFD
ncbi:MAG: hypothetical protein NTW52_19120 [Planctomycetota bacterium]|nr:hypothetical protein [Planctomycetota bacterium]